MSLALLGDVVLDQCATLDFIIGAAILKLSKLLPRADPVCSDEGDNTFALLEVLLATRQCVNSVTDNAASQQDLFTLWCICNSSGGAVEAICV